MLSDYTQLAVGKLKIEANWNDSVKPAKVFKITLGDKEEFIERDDLYALMMLFGDENQQEQLIPVQQLQVRSIKRLLKIKVKEDVKAGRTINAMFEYFVPEKVYESLLMHHPEQYQTSSLHISKLEKDINKIV